MATFYAGQRVRILWSNGWPELAGCEGRIVGRAGPGLLGDSEWSVAPDIWGSNLAPNPSPQGGWRFAPSSKQLEPLLPDGLQACDADFKRDLDRLLKSQGVSA